MTEWLNADETAAYLGISSSNLYSMAQQGMRVIVQNDPRHPDNYGYVVTHIGLNLDQQLEDFRDMEREDKAFFEDLISGKDILQNHKPDIPSDLQKEIRDYLSEVMDREGVRKDESKKIMDQTYI